MVTSGNPAVMFQNLMNTNPQFKQFVQENQGKTIEQIAQNYGIDINAIKQIL